mgnify:CR=1 FL=1
MKLNTLVLSDIHLPINEDMNSFSTNMLMLFDFLNHLISKEMKFDKIILNGDIIEDWYTRASKAFEQYPEIMILFFYKLKMLTQRIIFVKGNHDSSNVFGILPKKTREFLEDMKVEIYHNSFVDGNLYFAHGHRGENISPIFIFLNILAAQLAFTSLRWIANLFGTKGKTIFSKIKPYYNKMTNSTGAGETRELQEIYYTKVRAKMNVPDNMVLVCGHTHLPLILESPKVINDGDWMTNCTFVEIDHNSNIAFLCKYTGDGITIMNQMEL